MKTSRIFDPRGLLAFTLCVVGALLAVFSLASTPVETPRAHTSVPLASGAAQSDWSIVPSPNAITTHHNFLQSLTCLSRNDCWVVGYNNSPSGNQSLILHWNGTDWSIVPSPNTGVNLQIISGVGCASPSDCWVVGYYFDGNAYLPLILGWDGESWSRVPAAATASLENDFLYSVHCVSPDDCWTVGVTQAGPSGGVGPDQPLIEHWDGIAWSKFASPSIIPGRSHTLTDVTCVAEDDCWAIGYYAAVSANQTLAMHWDGSQWTIVSSANTSEAEDNFLSSVTCGSTADCWAVGVHTTLSADQTLVVHWDGEAWAVVPSPNYTTAQPNVLFDVACASPEDCWAVGYYRPSTTSQNLIAHWNGTEWSLFPAPNTSPGQTQALFGIACPVPWECWAVGNYYGANSLSRTLAMRYTGSPPPVQLLSVVSSKFHGILGPFDIDLPLTGAPGIECRSGGANGDYTLVFTFSNPLTSVGGVGVTSGIGNVSSSTIDSSDAHKYIVNLTGVTNAQVVSVGLTNLSDSAGNNSPSIPISMGVLFGDANGNGTVSNTDVADIKAQVAATVTASNFRTDVNSDGVVSNTDVADTKAKVSSMLP